MMTIMMLSGTLMTLAALVMTLASVLSKKMKTDREKNSPFECGFDPNGTARLPFSLRFFLITIIFLIFDVEITLLLPMAVIYENSNLIIWMMVSMTFIMILILGLYHEWNQGALNWAE